jgi:hypothetical protein
VGRRWRWQWKVLDVELERANSPLFPFLLLWSAVCGRCGDEVEELRAAGEDCIFVLFACFDYSWRLACLSFSKYVYRTQKGIEKLRDR